MADVNANINIDINASSALAQLKALETQISNFNSSIARSNVAAAAAQKNLNDAFRAQIDATGQFNTSIRSMESNVSSLGTAFDKGSLSAKQYFRYAASQMPGLTNAFRGLGKEQAEMASLAENRVKQLQTRYVSLGRDINGMQKMLAIQPKTLAAGYATDIALAEQRQQLFNRALQLGSTGMVNWGKNTQWAGRQLMVGFTVPMTIAAGAAAKFFMDLEKSGVAFRRVYGDMDTSTQEAQKNLQAIQDLGIEYTKYGLAVNEVIDIGARAAATGAQNDDLLAATEQTLRLATLGQTDYQTALDATISLQTAFGISSANLATTIDFLNAVENQTVLTLEDVARAVPRVAPVIKGLGGDVEDLAVFMTALREGGVSAEQGANALKSGLASLINPTARATETLKEMGINIKAIVDANRGDLMGTVRAFGQALESVSEFERQQALEATFGKYQYARLGALFKNIARDGSQAARAMQLAGMSVEDLASLSEKELSVLSESVTNKFLGAVERLKVAIAPIGEMFLKVATPIIEAVTNIANKFNELPDTVKAVIAGVVGAVGLIAPAVLMGIGLIANGIGNGLKFILLLRGGIKGLVAALTGSSRNFQYQSTAALDAAAAMSTLDGKTDALTGSLLMQDDAVRALAGAYGSLAGSARAAAASMPAAFPGVPVVGGRGGRGGAPIVRRAMGGTIPGTGNTDSVPALLTPGEFVVNKQAANTFGPVLEAINNSSVAKFARGGPVGFNVGGTSLSIDVASQQTITALQRRIDAAVANGAGAVEQLVSVLRGFANDTSVKISQIDDVIRAIPELQGIAQPTSYSAPSSIQGQTAKMTWTTRQSEIEAIQRSVAQDWPEIAADTEKMRNLTNNQTSHIEQINRNGQDVSKDWSDLSNLTPDLGGVNNYLNRVQGMTVGAEHIEQIMRETGLDFETVNAEVEKLKVGIHPTTAQAANVTKSLARLDNQLSLAAVAAGKTRTSLNTVAKTGYQAGAVSAALGARLSRADDQSFYNTVSQRTYSASQRMGANVVQGADDGMGNASPSRFAREAMDDFAAGIELGAAENSGKATKAGQKLGTAVNTGFDGTLSPAQTRGAVLLGGPGQPDAPTQSGIPIAARTPVADVDDDSQRVAAALSRQEDEIDGATKQTKTMKDRIRGVSGKLFGVSAALTGLSIAGSFMDGQIGQVAQSIMPFAFALDGITALLPMMMNPWGIAIAAVAAVGGGLWYLNNQMNDLRERAQDFGDALTLSAGEVNKVAEYFGTQSLVQRQQMINIAEQSGVKTKDVQAGLEFIGSDIGQEMAREFAIGLEQQGGAQSAQSFANKLASMMMQGVIDFSQAEQIAAGLAQQIGQPEISANIIGQLKRIVGPDGSDITRRPLQIAAEIIANEKEIVKSIQAPILDSFKNFEDVSGFGDWLTSSGLVAGGADIPYLTDLMKNLSLLNDDFEKAISIAQTYGKAVGNSLRNAYDNLNSAIIRNEEIISNAKKKDRPELRERALREEAELRKDIAQIQTDAQKNFANLVQENAALSIESLRSMQDSIKEIYQDPAMKLLVENIFAKTGGLSQELQFDILMSLDSGALSPQAANYLIDSIGDPELAMTTLNLLVKTNGLDKTNQFLLQNMQLGNEEIRKRVLVQYIVESGDREQVASILGYDDKTVQEAKTRYQNALRDFEQTGKVAAYRVGRAGAYTIEMQADEAEQELARLKAAHDAAIAEEKRYQDALSSGRRLVSGQDAGLRLEPMWGGMEEDEVKFTANAEAVNRYQLALEKLASMDIKPKIDLSEAEIPEEELERATKILEQFAALPENMQKTINVDTLQATSNMEVFDINWKNIDSFSALQKEIGVLDSFSSPMQAFGMSWAAFSSLPNIYKEIIVQYTLAVQKVEGEYKGMQAAGFQMSPDSAAGRIASQAALAAAPIVPEVDGGGDNVLDDIDTGGGGGGGGGEAAKSGADLIKEMIDGLKEQLKFLGDYKKVGDEVKSGLAQALRNAGAPEQLIADIIAKGADGIKMAKELLKDKAKKLKEVTNLMLEVTRLTFVESQRAEAANLATQASAQIALANAGLNPAVIANMDPQQAQAVAAAYRAYQTAQRAADAAEDKSKKKRQEANRELAKARKEWEMVTDAVNKNTAAQDKNAIAQALLTAQQERQTAQNRVSAALALAGRGMSSEQIGGILEIEGAANQVVAYTDKIKQLNEEKAKLEAKDRKNWSDEEKKRYQQLQRQLKKVNGDYRELLRLLAQINKEQAQGNIATVTGEFAGQAVSARKQRRATDILMGQGYSYDEASGMAGSEENARAITDAQSAVAEGERKVNSLLQERSKYPKGSKEYKELSEKIKEARAKLNEAKTAQDNLNASIAQASEEQKQLDWQSVLGAITTEIGKQANAQKFLNMGISDQLVLSKLNGLTLDQQNIFLSLSVEEQNAFIAALQKSIPLVEKIAQSFEEIENRQRLISLQNKERANAEKGNREDLEAQAEAQDDLARAKQKEIDAAQDLIAIQQELNDDLQHQIDLTQRQIDLIQRQSDQLNRGLEIISQEEEKINKFYDDRLASLDKVEQSNQRIAQQQQDQLNLAQALSTGDIYSAVGAAQQMRASQAQFAADQARQTLEDARQKALENITVSVNGQLMKRRDIEEQIRKNEEQIYQLNQLMLPIQDQIYANNLEIYRIQDTILEPLQEQLNLINDQRAAIDENIRAWDRYYKYLEDNAVDPVTGIKFKDLAAIREQFNARMAQGVTNPATGEAYTEEEAFTEATAGRNLTPETLARLKTVLFREDTSEIISPDNAAAAGEAAKKATPEVTKLKDEFVKVKDAIVALVNPIKNSGKQVDSLVKDSVVPLQESFKNAGNIVEGNNDSLLQKITNIKDFVVNSLIPEFSNLIVELNGATLAAQALQSALNAIERNITVTVTTQYVSSGAPTEAYKGGMIKGYAMGGSVFGNGSRDSVAAMLTPGEFVVRKSMVDKYGAPMLNKLNQGSLNPSYSVPGGNVSYRANSSNRSTVTTVAPVYNTYSVQINAETNASADEIANKAAMKIREMNSMSLRSARG